MASNNLPNLDPLSPQELERITGGGGNSSLPAAIKRPCGGPIDIVTWTNDLHAPGDPKHARAMQQLANQRELARLQELARRQEILRTSPYAGFPQLRPGAKH